MKSLFRENHTYTEDAGAVEDMISSQVNETFRTFIELGYSPREISHVMQSLIGVMESEQVLNMRLVKKETP